MFSSENFKRLERKHIRDLLYLTSHIRSMSHTFLKFSLAILSLLLTLENDGMFFCYYQQISFCTILTNSWYKFNNLLLCWKKLSFSFVFRFRVWSTLCCRLYNWSLSNSDTFWQFSDPSVTFYLSYKLFLRPISFQLWNEVEKSAF